MPQYLLRRRAYTSQTCFSRSIDDVYGNPINLNLNLPKEINLANKDNEPLLPRRPVTGRFPTHDFVFGNVHLIDIGTMIINYGGQLVGHRPHMVFACFNIVNGLIAIDGDLPRALPLLRLVTIGVDDAGQRFPAETHMFDGVQLEGFELFDWSGFIPNPTLQGYLNSPIMAAAVPNPNASLLGRYLLTFTRLHLTCSEILGGGGALPRNGPPDVAPLSRQFVGAIPVSE